MKTAFLIGAGEGYDLSVFPQAGDVVIAVDGGWSFCRSKGITPQLLLGDFDSLSDVPKSIPLLRLPVEKDDTDMRVATHEALKQGCEVVHIFGGTGGRPDHTFANYQVLLDIAKSGARGFLWGNTHAATVMGKGKLTFPPKTGGDLSLFAFGGNAKGVTISGAKYTASEIDLTPDYPLAVSNSFVGNRVEISLEGGFLLVIWEKEAGFLPLFA